MDNVFPLNIENNAKQNNEYFTVLEQISNYQAIGHS